MRNKILICSLFIGCATPEPNCALNQQSQTGLYSMFLTEESGDCGALGHAEVEVGNGIPLLGASQCIVSEGEWTQAACNTRSVVDCDDGIWVLHLEWNVHSVDASSETLAGTLSAEMDKWDGIYTCTGDYSFKANIIK